MFTFVRFEYFPLFTMDIASREGTIGFNYAEHIL